MSFELSLAPTLVHLIKIAILLKAAAWSIDTFIFWVTRKDYENGI